MLREILEKVEIHIRRRDEIKTRIKGLNGLHEDYDENKFDF